MFQTFLAEMKYLQKHQDKSSNKIQLTLSLTKYVCSIPVNYTKANILDYLMLTPLVWYFTSEILINNYSPKAKWILLNNSLNFVSGIVQNNVHWAQGEQLFQYNYTGDYLKESCEIALIMRPINTRDFQ